MDFLPVLTEGVAAAQRQVAHAATACRPRLILGNLGRSQNGRLLRWPLIRGRHSLAQLPPTFLLREPRRLRLLRASGDPAPREGLPVEDEGAAALFGLRLLPAHLPISPQCLRSLRRVLWRGRRLLCVGSRGRATLPSQLVAHAHKAAEADPALLRPVARHQLKAHAAAGLVHLQSLHQAALQEHVDGCLILPLLHQCAAANHLPNIRAVLLVVCCAPTELRGRPLQKPPKAHAGGSCVNQDVIPVLREGRRSWVVLHGLT
mmetsp:Transcript_50991/g.152488  ORF Transcript_50991/g.152488 Transcript_50991/m.152488 type:complete len:261 (+) Transcript_50991:759-1541(+)